MYGSETVQERAFFLGGEFLKLGLEPIEKRRAGLLGGLILILLVIPPDDRALAVLERRRVETAEIAAARVAERDQMGRERGLRVAPFFEVDADDLPR